jgi:2-polyprenyl-3-methyl-5-hydroxy-6-metoxy-1,4-benzoquinol methylase
MVHHTRCPLCLSEMISVHFRCTDHFISKEVFDIARCSSCGFLFTQDYPDENEITRYYESVDYISHSDTSKGLLNKLYHLVRQFMLIRKKSIVTKATGLKTGNLLDIGSGTGHFASVMKKSGWNVKGIEINEKARKSSSSAFGLDIYSPDEISGFEKQSLDCVTLWHVLEHLPNPEEYLLNIFNILKTGGVCIAALPNSSSFDAKFYRNFWAAFDVPRHLWHFDTSTFTLFSEKSPLRIERMSVLPFDVFYISLLSERYRGSQFPFIRGLMSGTCFAFLSLFNSNRSSSVIYILRKSAVTSQS